MTEPTRLGDDLTAAMSQVDGCPECPNTQPADAAIPAGDGWQVRFVCADCGTSWSRRFDQVSPVEERDSRRAMWENGGTNQDGPRPAALTAGSSRGLARRYEGAPN